MTTSYAPLANNNYQPQMSIRLAERKPFTGKTMQACVWLFILKRYFIATGFIYKSTETADTPAACQYAVVLMVGNAARWMDMLKDAETGYVSVQTVCLSCGLIYIGHGLSFMCFRRVLKGLLVFGAAKRITPPLELFTTTIRLV